MAQRLMYQEPLPLTRGGTGQRVVATGLLAGNTGNTLKRLTGTDSNVLRSNGAVWEYAMSGRLIQMIHSTYAISVVSSNPTWIPTGLTGQINPRRSDSQIIAVAKQCGIGRNNTLGVSAGVGLFRLMWNGNSLRSFAHPFAYTANGPYSLGLGTATCIVTVTPGNTNTQFFATQIRNENSNIAGSNLYTQWEGFVPSSMLLLEVAPA